MSWILRQTDLRITNHKGHKFPPSLAFLSFKTRIELTSVLNSTASFPTVFYQILHAALKTTSKLFGSQSCSDDKNCIDFSRIFFGRSVDFEAQFCFRCTFSFHEKPFESRLNGMIFLGQSLLRMATNEIDLFCKDNMQITSNGLSRVCQRGQRPVFL